MRGIKAKRIRKITYGDNNFRERTYYKREGIVIADDKRQEYQWRKGATK